MTDVISILDGSLKTPTARLLRAATSLAEPAYAGVMRLRNLAFDRGIKKSFDLGRPTISVGNLTTGGTGKTPVVKWLANRLRQGGDRPAVLMRGYHADASGSDEQRELDRSLNGDTAVIIPVHADGSRVRGAAAVLASRPDVSAFILDDGLQHRAAARQFDLVLINATSPFGFGHVLPRGLLREPLNGLKRASAILITHQSQASNEQLAAIFRTVRGYTDAPVFRADHQLTGLWQAKSGAVVSIDTSVVGTPLVVAGIGSPQSFLKSLERHAGRALQSRFFPDHHRYAKSDWSALIATAKAAGCDRIVTTEKDWSKLSTLAKGELAVEVARLGIVFADEGEADLLNLLRAVARA